MLKPMTDIYLINLTPLVFNSIISYLDIRYVDFSNRFIVNTAELETPDGRIVNLVLLPGNYCNSEYCYYVTTTSPLNIPPDTLLILRNLT